MASQRYRATSPITYATALLALVRYARTSDHDFTFGPVRLADAVRSGLDVTATDLSPIQVMLAAIPGLAPADD